jgi:hypothetical protein
MNPVDPIDDEWSVRFQALKESDAETAPPFSEMWGRARRIAAVRSQNIRSLPRILSYAGAAASLLLGLFCWRLVTVSTSQSLAESLPPLLSPAEGSAALFSKGIAFADSASLPSDGLLPFYLHLTF